MYTALYSLSCVGIGCHDGRSSFLLGMRKKLVHCVQEFSQGCLLSYLCTLVTLIFISGCARVFVYCPVDSRASLNHDSLLFSPLFYSFLQLSAREELQRTTSPGVHAKLHQGTANIRGTESALSRPVCPRTTALLKRRQRFLRRRRLLCRPWPQATKNKSFPWPWCIVWTQKEKPTAQTFFFSIPSSLLVPSSTFTSTFVCDGPGCVSHSLAQ